MTSTAWAVTLNTSMAADIVNIDPAHMSIGHDRMIAHQVLEGLVEWDCGQSPCTPVPRLAENYQISKDAKMLTFHLRKGVQFHHGYGEFTSEDVKYNLKRHMDPKIGSRVAPQAANIARIDTPDKYTVAINLKIPSAYSLLRNMAWQGLGKIVSKVAFGKLGDKIALFPVGTGAFYFDSWNPGEKVVLKKFNKYWGELAKVDEVVYRILREEIVALSALGKGELDITPITQKGSYEFAEKLKNVHILEANAAAYHHHLFFNNGKPPLNDVRVRRALIYALDFETINKRLGPQTSLWTSPLPSAVFAATKEFWKYEYDVKKAKALLSEAGFPNGFKLKLIYKHEAINEAIALEVSNYWKKILDVDLELIDQAVYYKRAKEFKHHVAFIYITRFSPFLYAQFYLTGSPRNYFKYSNPELDEVIKKAQIAASPEASSKYWREFQKIVVDEAVGAWCALMKSQMAVSDRLGGLSPGSLLPYRGLVDLKDIYFK